MTSHDRPTVVLDRYALFDAIARGGMATVHIGRLAGAGGFSKTVAIKRMHEHLANNPDFVDMFVDEARLAGRIQHPNVANVLDVVARDHEAFLVLEYLDGESMSTLLKKQFESETKLPVEFAVQIVREALLGLHAAHEAKDWDGGSLEIVHRDVSPQNILVGADGISRVLDFGIAKAVGRVQDSTTGQLKGKISYMAPEQVVGHGVDRRVDVYAAGIVLWEALAGRRLFTGGNSAELVYRILEDEIPELSTERDDVTDELCRAVAKATSRSREERFATAKEFATSLEECTGVISQNKVAEFVLELSGDQLEKRRARIRAIEALSLEDVGDMPTGEELVARASSPDVTQSLVLGDPNEETYVDRPDTGTETVAEAAIQDAAPSEDVLSVNKAAPSATTAPPQRPIWFVPVVAAGVAAVVAVVVSSSGRPGRSELAGSPSDRDPVTEVSAQAPPVAPVPPGHPASAGELADEEQPEEAREEPGAEKAEESAAPQAEPEVPSPKTQPSGATARTVKPRVRTPKPAAKPRAEDLFSRE